MEYVSLETLLRESDIVSLHCPLNDSSRGLIDTQKLGLMKSSALLLNAARGPVVDSQALAEALDSGAIAGAGIDVFEVEPPLPADHPLLHCKNILVTPHVAFASRESMEALSLIHIFSAVSSPRSDSLPRSRPALCFAAVRPLLF